jgi:hypothetical protein
VGNRGRGTVRPVHRIADSWAFPAHAQSQTPAGRLGTQFTYTYYATAAHTGEAVGEWVFGYCPTYFSDTFGTKTAYCVLSEELISVHLGRFQRTRTRMMLAMPRSGQPRTVEVIKTEEKGTDVNIASYVLLDAFRVDSDLAVIVSNDADLAEPMRIVLRELGMDVGIANPFRRPSSELSRVPVTLRRQIREKMLAASQLPPVLDGKQGLVSRPVAW